MNSEAFKKFNLWPPPLHKANSPLWLWSLSNSTIWPLISKWTPHYDLKYPNELHTMIFNLQMNSTLWLLISKRTLHYDLWSTLWPLTTHLAVEVATHGLLGPRLVVVVCSSLLLRIPHHVRHRLQREPRHLAKLIP